MNEAAWLRRGRLYVPLALLLSWQLASLLPGFPLQTVSRPVDVAAAMASALIDGSLLTATAETMASTFAGVAVGAALGVIAGLVVGVSRGADRASSALVECLRPVPAIAIMPLALLVFGFGFSLEIAVIAFASFWPVMILLRSAVRGVDPQTMEVARALEFSGAERLRKFLLPSVLREIFVAMQLAIGVAFVVAVTVEIAVNPMGLGYRLVSAQVALRADLVFGCLLWVGLVGWTTSACLKALENRLFRWSVQR